MTFLVQGTEKVNTHPLLHSYVVEGTPILLPYPVFLNSEFLKISKFTISLIKFIPKLIKN